MNRSHFSFEFTIVILFHLAIIAALIDKDTDMYLLAFIVLIIPMAILQVAHAIMMYVKFPAKVFLQSKLKRYFGFVLIYLSLLPFVWVMFFIAKKIWMYYVGVGYLFVIPHVFMFYLLWITYKASSSLVE
jgi:hypothetical protein